MPEILENALNQLQTRNCEWFGLREVREQTTTRVARDGKPQSNEIVESHGVMVEVLSNGSFAYSSTCDLSLSGIKAAFDSALKLAERSAAHRLHSFSKTVRPPTKLEYRSPVQRSLSELSGKDLADLLVQISLKLKISPRIIRTSATALAVESETHFISSNGARGSQKFSIVSGDFEATAQRDNLVQRRSLAGFRGRSFQGGTEQLFGERLFGDRLWASIQEIAEQSLELLEAEPCPTETTSLILMPDQMMLQIHESVGHPLELDRILGDERNYAGWSFVNPNDFGKLQYGSKLMNITFDPTLPHELASYAFDDIGNPATKEFLIKQGRLVRGLGSLESQARLGLPGVANQRACLWNRPPIDRMANLNLEPGTTTLDEMIAATKRGILMTTNRSWSIDDFRNKFQFGCEYAKQIENGKVTKTLRNPNYRGVSVPFWNHLKMVGNSRSFEAYGTPYCGKGEPNQIIRVGHASPPCLFENVEVFGGES